MSDLESRFFKAYNRVMKNTGGDKEKAMRIALENCYLYYYVEDNGGKFEDESLNEIWQEYRNKRVKEDNIEWRDNYIKNATIKYHKIGEPFIVNGKNGKQTKLVAVESNDGCNGCIFFIPKMEAAMGGFRRMYHCKLADYNKHAICKAGVLYPYRFSGKYTRDYFDRMPLRMDNKDVIFKKQ